MPDLAKGILWLLFVLSVLVVVHEWGHFVAARFFRMRVEEFSLFFGPIVARLGRRGETHYNVRAIPLGGFVKIAGMEADDISGGRPIMEALRNPRLETPENADEAVSQALADVDADQVSDGVRALIRDCMGPDGELTAEGRHDLEIKQYSPSITPHERRLLQVVLAADRQATDPALYSRKPLYQRALVIFAGPFMSLLFGYLLFCAMGMTMGLPTDKTTNQVQQVMPDGAGHRAGLRTGDRIVAIDDMPVRGGKDMVEKIHDSANKPLYLTISRDGRIVHMTATPRPTPMTYVKDGKKVTETVGLLGFVPNSEYRRLGLTASVVAGTRVTGAYMTELVTTLFSKKVKESVGGPIAMGQMATAYQRLGPAHMLIMAAMFSLSLGVMNLLPIPILDGGHLLLLGIEKVRRRKLSAREIQRAQLVGLGLLAMLVIFVFFNDISRTLAGRAMQ